MERRKSVRFNLCVPLLFTWESGDGKHQNGGFSSNISRCGVHVVCMAQACPAVGSAIALELALPRPAPNVPTVQLKGEGRVARHETRPDGVPAFAAEAEFSIHAGS